LPYWIFPARWLTRSAKIWQGWASSKLQRATERAAIPIERMLAVK